LSSHASPRLPNGLFPLVTPISATCSGISSFLTRSS
jgi:hypothetical protein